MLLGYMLYYDVPLQLKVGLFDLCARANISKIRGTNEKDGVLFRDHTTRRLKVT